MHGMWHSLHGSVSVTVESTRKRARARTNAMCGPDVCVTVLLCYCVSLLLCYFVTVLLCYCVSLLLYYCITVLLCYCVSLLLCLSLCYCFCVCACRSACLGVLIWICGVGNAVVQSGGDLVKGSSQTWTTRSACPAMRWTNSPVSASETAIVPSNDPEKSTSPVWSCTKEIDLISVS